MRKKLQRGLCLILCVVMAFSCMVVPAGAVVVSPLIVEAAKTAGTAVISWFVNKAVDEGLQMLKDWIDGKSADTDGLIAHIGALKTAQRTKVSEDTLRELAYEWNSTCSAAVGFTVDVVDHRLDTGEVYRVIAVRRGYVATTAAVQYCLADGIGRILYADATTELSGRWAPEGQTSGRHLLDYNTLFNLSQEVGGLIRLKDNFYEIYKRDGTVYCNVAGRRFSSIYDSDKAAVNQDRPTSSGTVTNNNTTNNYISNEYVDEGDTIYIKEGDTYHETNYDITNIEEGDTWYIREGNTYYEIVIDNSQHIDIENMTQVLPGGTQNVIDNLIYDDNTKTYYVDSHDVTNNTTNFYTYQYHINYTSVTYIGQTEEYSKQYELYYQLPDGRSSADLTAEDLEQLSASFKDVINYARAADDLNQRALYHFDGNTEDSSYWSYCSSFDWAKGASITYMDEGTFGGSLYLDETEHDFTLTLPANDAAGDFTLQFRYYQSHTEAPQLDSFLSIGGTTVLQFDGASYYDASGAVIAATSVGSWNELCLMREDGVVYYYINGVPYGSMSLPIGTSAVRFYFGADQQTYKKIDELRFTRGAIYDAGKGYTPTSVPYDSNLSLVLPFGTIPMADEVMVFKPSANNLFSAVSLADWTKSSAVGALKPYVSTTSFDTAYSRYQSVGVSLYRNPSYTTVLHDGDSILLSTAGIIGTEITASGNPERSDLANGLYLPVCTTERHYDYSNSEVYYNGHTLYTPGQDYTLSVLLSDGSYSYLTFRVVAHADNTRTYYSVSVVDQALSSVVHIDACDMTYWTEITNDNRWDYEDTYRITNYGFRLCPSSAGTTADIIYMELVKGSMPEFSVSWEGAVYDPGTLTESPVLAVRSNTDITTYQIGGVRPSYPEKGQVYAMVESGYITSLQQYTGSVWEAVDGRIWTGSRWIPASSYNVITLQDMYDIADATQDYEYIYTESGFWSWFQRAWQDLISRLDKIIDGLGDGSSGACQHVYESQIDDEATCTDPGHMIYTCLICGHIYTELIDALGHDWVVTDRVESVPMPDVPVIPEEPAPDPSVLAIIQQPEDVYALEGETFTISVEATGVGLSYQWYYRNTWSEIFELTTSFNSNFYTTEMNSMRSGRQVYCVITDASGNSVQTNTVTMHMGVAPPPKIVITQQPQDVYVEFGDPIEIYVEATGFDLTYRWYYRNPGSAIFEYTTTFNSNFYITEMNYVRNGRQVYCVISDAEGNAVQTDTVIMLMVQTRGYDILTCSCCGATAEDHGNGIVSPGGAPYEDFSITGLFLDVFDGAWSVIVGVVNTGFGGLGGFVEGFSVFPDFFALYRPSNQTGVLGIYNYGGADIWD